MRTLLLGAASALLLSSAAAAQSNDMVVGPVVEGFDLDRLEGLLRDADIQSTRSTERGQTFLLATTSTGAKFLVVPSACADDTLVTGCKMAEITAFFANSPIPLQMMNRFHIQGTTGTIAMGAPGNTLVTVRKVYALGGVREAHFSANLALFFRDMQTLIGTLRDAASLVQHEGGTEAAPSLAEAQAEAFPSIMVNAAQASDAPGALPFGYEAAAMAGLRPLDERFAAPELAEIAPDLD